MVIPRGRIPLLAGGAAVVLAAAILIQQRSAPVGKTDSNSEPPLVAKTTGPENRPTKPRSRPQASAFNNLPDLPAPVEPPHPPGSPENQDWIAQRITVLDDLAWRDDPESLAKILAELRNPLPEIRTAALQATRAFGSRDAIPYLAAISRDSKDPLEQKAIHDLIEHLNLPTVLEQSDWDEIE